MKVGDIILAGEITDLTFKVGRVTHASPSVCRTEPMYHPKTGQCLGAWAQFDIGDSKPIRVLPSIDSAFKLHRLRRKFQEEQAGVKATYDKSVALWIGNATCT